METADAELPPVPRDRPPPVPAVDTSSTNGGAPQTDFRRRSSRFRPSARVAAHRRNSTQQQRPSIPRATNPASDDSHIIAFLGDNAELQKRLAEEKALVKVEFNCTAQNLRLFTDSSLAENSLLTLKEEAEEAFYIPPPQLPSSIRAALATASAAYRTVLSTSHSKPTDISLSVLLREQRWLLSRAFNDCSLLHYACIANAISTVELLLSHGADPTALNRQLKDAAAATTSSGRIRELLWATADREVLKMRRQSSLQSSIRRTLSADGSGDQQVRRGRHSVMNNAHWTANNLRTSVFTVSTNDTVGEGVDSSKRVDNDSDSTFPAQSTEEQQQKQQCSPGKHHQSDDASAQRSSINSCATGGTAKRRLSRVLQTKRHKETNANTSKGSRDKDLHKQTELNSALQREKATAEKVDQNECDTSVKNANSKRSIVSSPSSGCMDNQAEKKLTGDCHQETKRIDQLEMTAESLAVEMIDAQRRQSLSLPPPVMRHLSVNNRDIPLDSCSNTPQKCDTGDNVASLQRRHGYDDDVTELLNIGESLEYLEAWERKATTGTISSLPIGKDSDKSTMHIIGSAMLASAAPTLKAEGARAAAQLISKAKQMEKQEVRTRQRLQSLHRMYAKLTPIERFAERALKAKENDESSSLTAVLFNTQDEDDVAKPEEDTQFFQLQVRDEGATEGDVEAPANYFSTVGEVIGSGGDSDMQSNRTSTLYALTFREMLWRRAARHMNGAQYDSGRSEYERLRMEAYHEGQRLLLKEFRSYAHRAKWEAVDFIEKLHVQEMSLSTPADRAENANSSGIGKVKTAKEGNSTQSTFSNVNTTLAQPGSRRISFDEDLVRIHEFRASDTGAESADLEDRTSFTALSADQQYQRLQAITDSLYSGAQGAAPPSPQTM